MRIGIIGATGMVGRNIMTILREENFPMSELVLMASERSVGKTIEHAGYKGTVQSIEEGLNASLDIVFFAAGSATSEIYAKQFSSKGVYVIDNSSLFRMEESVPLIVPEVNGEQLAKGNYLIANPNCSTAQLVMVLSPIAKKYGLEEVIVSTYQSVSGSGVAGLEQLENEAQGKAFDAENSCYAAPIHQNLIPHIDSFLDNGYTKEEIKLMVESKKILSLPNLKISATAVRVPVTIGHSESVSMKLSEEITDLDAFRDYLNAQQGIIVQDDTAALIYPTPLAAAHKNEVFVGRIRKDLDDAKSIHAWVVSDNLRKGAAYNAVQIAQLVKERFF